VRTDPPENGPEADQLAAFLDFQRATVLLKCEGMSPEQLARAAVPSSELTLGGLLNHLALVEDWWFRVQFLGEEHVPPWAEVDWDADPDWEFRTAADDSPDELRRLLGEAIANSDQNIRHVLDADGLDGLSVRESRHAQEGRFSLRWILLHMIEEYARHNGHADLIRESIDGSTGE
jgi:uncharacterized damage-inducible protein DinB